MLRYLPAFLLLGFVLEITSIIWAGRALGVIATLLLLGAGGVAGIMVFKSAGMSVAAALKAPMQDPASQFGLAGATMLRVMSGVLFFIPGFFSDMLAFLLLFSPVQRWLLSRVKIKAPSGGPHSSSRTRFDKIIEADAVEIEGEFVPPGRPGKDR